MNIKKILRELWVDEAVPNPITKLITPYQYSDESPEVSFKQKIYYHSISPQIQVGVTGYARLLDLANIQINSDNEQAKKLIEDWNDLTDFKTKLEALGNTFLICGNAILEKLDDKNTQDVAEVDMSSIIGKKRDEYGNTLYYTQQSALGTIKLGETKLNRFIEFNLNTISRSVWSPCIFESAAIPRKVGNRITHPLVELVVGLEDAMSTIILNNAYPEVYYTFEGANEDQLKKETEKIRRKKPGDRVITTKAPKIELFEAKGQSAYVDYIQYMYKSLSLAVKFPTDILTGDFTSRASSNTTEDLTTKLANAIKRYMGNKLKQELYDPILAQNGINPKDANLQVTFGTQEIIKMTPEIAGKRFTDKIWSIEEVREWDKDNAGVDLFDDDLMSNDMVKQASDLAQQNMNKSQPQDTQILQKKIESLEKQIPKPIDESILKRQEEIKEKFYTDTVDKLVKDGLRDAVEELKESIEDKKFNKKVKSEILETLTKLTGEQDGRI